MLVVAIPHLSVDSAVILNRKVLPGVQREILIQRVFIVLASMTIAHLKAVLQGMNLKDRQFLCSTDLLIKGRRVVISADGGRTRQLIDSTVYCTKQLDLAALQAENPPPKKKMLKC